jgi:hypothetical protein
MNEFFPANKPDSNLRLTAHKFHSNLKTPAETRRIYKAGEEAWEFIRASAEKAQDILDDEHNPQ